MFNQTSSGIRSIQSHYCKYTMPPGKFYIQAAAHHSHVEFKSEFEQSLCVLDALGLKLKKSKSCLKLEVDRDTSTTSPDEAEQQQRAAQQLFTLAYLHQSGNHTEPTRAMLRSSRVQQKNEYSSSITTALNLLLTKYGGVGLKQWSIINLAKQIKLLSTTLSSISIVRFLLQTSLHTTQLEYGHNTKFLANNDHTINISGSTPTWLPRLHHNCQQAGIWLEGGWSALL